MNASRHRGHLGVSSYFLGAQIISMTRRYRGQGLAGFMGWLGGISEGIEVSGAHGVGNVTILLHC